MGLHWTISLLRSLDYSNMDKWFQCPCLPRTLDSSIPPPYLRLAFLQLEKANRHSHGLSSSSSLSQNSRALKDMISLSFLFVSTNRRRAHECLSAEPSVPINASFHNAMAVPPSTPYLLYQKAKWYKKNVLLPFFSGLQKIFRDELCFSGSPGLYKIVLAAPHAMLSFLCSCHSLKHREMGLMLCSSLFSIEIYKKKDRWPLLLFFRKPPDDYGYLLRSSLCALRIFKTYTTVPNAFFRVVLPVQDQDKY